LVSHLHYGAQQRGLVSLGPILGARQYPGLGDIAGKAILVGFRWQGAGPCLRWRRPAGVWGGLAPDSAASRCRLRQARRPAR